MTVYEYPDPEKDRRPWPTLDAEIAVAWDELAQVLRRIEQHEKILGKLRQDEINIKHRIAQVQTLRLEQLAVRDDAWDRGVSADRNEE